MMLDSTPKSLTDGEPHLKGPASVLITLNAADWLMFERLEDWRRNSHLTKSAHYFLEDRINAGRILYERAT